MVPERLGVIGLGAMGGSLAWQARKRGIQRVVAYARDRRDGVAALREDAITTLEGSPEQVVRAVDFLVLAAPPATNQALVRSLAPLIAKRRVIVTDVTSVKRPFVAALAEKGLQELGAGSHPLCGTERSGFSAARPDLYCGAVVYVTPVEQETGACREIVDFWQRVMDASPVVINAERHDEILAWTSHLPQAVSSALAVSLSREAPRGVSFGPGALDATRIAASSVPMWVDVLRQNRSHVIDALSRFEHAVGELRDALMCDDEARIEAFLTEGSIFRRGQDR